MMIYNEIYSFFQSDKRIVIREGDTLAELKLLPSDTFKLAVSSPTYNIGKEYEKQNAENAIFMPRYWMQ